MKRIIALYGHAECGKSRTMNILRELIRENGKSISSNPPCCGEQRETFLFNGQVVCLCPGGDDGAVVKGNFAYAASKNADIIITACRTRGESINEVYKQEKLGLKIVVCNFVAEFLVSTLCTARCRDFLSMTPMNIGLAYSKC